MPANTAFPISISGFQGINTSVPEQKAGTFVLDRIEADVPTSIDLPAQPDLRPDPLISDDGSLPEGPGTWQFATLSDVQFTADNPALTQVATAAVKRIRTTEPDLIVLNGDITDRGLPQDLALARQVLTDAGCDLIPVGQEAVRRQHAGPGRRLDPVLLRAGQPRVLRPQQRPVRPDELHQRVRPAVPDVRPQGHPASSCSPARSGRCARRRGTSSR